MSSLIESCSFLSALEWNRFIHSEGLCDSSKPLDDDGPIFIRPKSSQYFEIDTIYGGLTPEKIQTLMKNFILPAGVKVKLLNQNEENALCMFYTNYKVKIHTPYKVEIHNISGSVHFALKK